MSADSGISSRDNRPVLITGGAGFLGSAVAEALLAGGRRVRVLDVNDFESGAVRQPGLECVRGSVLDAALVDECVSGTGLVLHLAAEVGVDRYVSDPESVLDVNILGTRHVLRSALRHGAKVLFASSSEVYGKNQEVLDEDSDSVFGATRHSRWSYALSKAVGEQYVRALGRRGLSFAIVRPFNAYGPLIDDPGNPESGRVISKFIGCLRDGRPLALVDGGRAVRSFTYVDDVVEGICRVALALEQNGSVAGHVYNVGRADPVTIRSLAERMIRLSGRSVGMVDVPGERFFGAGFEEIPYRSPDVSALRSATGFSAQTDLEEGLRRTLAHWNLLGPETTPPSDVLPAVRPRLPSDARLTNALGAVLRSGRVTNDGPVVRQFEKDMAGWLGVPEVVAVSSGAAALQLAFAALGRRDGVVILPSFTYIATLAGFSHFGLQPVFCDIEPDTWTMSPAHLQALVTEQRAKGVSVAAVVPVNVFGVPPDLARIAQIASGAGAALVYDNAHGMGTTEGGRRLAPQPLMTAFSLHATKVLPAVEGGLLAASDGALASELRRLRGHGLAANVLESTPGWNARMNELCASVAARSLDNLEGNLKRRRKYAVRLREALAGTGRFTMQAIPDGVKSNFQNLGVLCASLPSKGPQETIDAFLRQGVEARRYFHPPLHRLRQYRNAAPLPVTEHVASHIVCLPLHDRMSEEDIERVERAARSVAEYLRP